VVKALARSSYLLAGAASNYTVANGIFRGVSEDEDDPLIGLTEMARRAGVKPNTMTRYRSQGRLPPPDDVSVRDRPRWRVSTFDAWMKARPGRGARTDVRGRGEHADE
jgi:predicted DNA-binding transcriptional regulator AlpA